MTSNFNALMNSPEVRRAQQVAYSVTMVGDIASSYDSALDRQEFGFARCMLDAFYVHVRLLADFLIKTTHGRDFGPGDFGIDWTKPDTTASGRLEEYWDIASKYVVHFGHPRVPQNVEDLHAFRVGGQLFRQMAGDALEVFGQFLSSLESKTSDWQDGPLIPDPTTDPNGWNLRIRAEQVAILKAAFGRARRELRD